MAIKTVYTEVEIDTDEILSGIDTEDLIDELKSRNGFEETFSETLYNFLMVIYNKKRCGQDYSKDLDELIYQYLGKIV